MSSIYNQFCSSVEKYFSSFLSFICHIKNWKAKTENKVKSLNTNSTLINSSTYNKNLKNNSNNAQNNSIKFLQVNYVKELSPAGKAALEAQESGE